jgi:hypothetical protein
MNTAISIEINKYEHLNILAHKQTLTLTGIISSACFAVRTAESLMRMNALKLVICPCIPVLCVIWGNFLEKNEQTETEVFNAQNNIIKKMAGFKTLSPV